VTGGRRHLPAWAGPAQQRSVHAVCRCPAHGPYWYRYHRPWRESGQARHRGGPHGL